MKYVTDKVEWRRITGRKPTVQPAFYVQGQGSRPPVLGYVDAPGLLQVLGKIVVALGKAIWNKRHKDPDLDPPPEPPEEKPPVPKLYERKEEPAKPKEETLDWTHAAVLFLIPEMVDVGGFDRVVGKAEELGSGIVSRKIFDVTDNKVSPYWVFERTRPERYKAVSESLGAKSGIFILVSKQDVGFAKSIAVKKIENQLPDKLKRLPFDVIFERTQGELYADVESAMKVKEPMPLPDIKDEKEPSLIGDALSIVTVDRGMLLSLLAERVWAWRRRRKQMAPVTGEPGT